MKDSFEECQKFKPKMYLLSAEDDFALHCGAVHLTLHGRLIFECSLCVDGCGPMEDCLQHLQEAHYVQDELHQQLNGGESEVQLQREVLPLVDVETDDLAALLELSVSDTDELEETNSNSSKQAHETMGEDAAQNNAISELENVTKEDSMDSCTDAMDNETGLSDLFANTTLTPLHKCLICGKCFSKKNYLDNHERRHNQERNFKCTICGRAFVDRSNCATHIERHKQPKYECSTCAKKFTTRLDLNVHNLTHTEEKPHLCSICGRSFSRSGALNSHMKRHQGIRTHKCQVCSKAFSTKGQLLNHVVSHTTERPFACTTCGATFQRKKTLHMHEKLHLNAREFKCNYCDKSFNQSPALFIHLKSSHGIKMGNRRAVFKINERASTCIA